MIHELRTSVIAFVICFVSSDSIARIRIFSSLTRNGRYLIFLSFDGKFNSYVGVVMVGNGIIYNFSILYRGQIKRCLTESIDPCKSLAFLEIPARLFAALLILPRAEVPPKAAAEAIARPPNCGIKLPKVP